MAKQPKAFSPSGYYRVRLEHTLKHTQQITRLIYLVNGGTLSLLYFVVKIEPAEIGSHRKYIVAAILGALAFINVMHGMLIARQGQWYKLLDNAFALASGARKEGEEMERPRPFPILGGTHTIHALLHLGLAAILAIGMCLVLLISN